MNHTLSRVLGPILALALSVLPPSMASAAQFCVGTGDQFLNALNSAQSNGVDDEIRIRTGTLTRNTAPASSFAFTYSSELTQDLAISGGWNANCTQQSHDPRLTVLSGSGQWPVLALGHYGAGAEGQLSLRNLSIRNGRGADTLYATGLQVTAWDGGRSDVHIEHVLVQLNDNFVPVGPGHAVRLMDTSNGRLNLTMRNVQIDSNRNRGLIIASANPMSVYRISQTTVTANLITFAELPAVATVGSGFAWLANNVFADNSVATDLSLGINTPSHLRNNHIGGLSGTPGSNQGMTTGDPRLVADGAWWRPGVGSPLRDSGVAVPNGGTGTLDIAGNPRLQGSAVDRGAYEAAPDLDHIWRNGFQTN